MHFLRRISDLHFWIPGFSNGEEVKQLRIWRLKGNGGGRCGEELLASNYFLNPASCDRIKTFLFLTHLWQESASLLWVLSLSYWKNVRLENILQLGWKKKKVVENPFNFFPEKHIHTQESMPSNVTGCVYVAYNYVHSLCVCLHFSLFPWELGVGVL